MVSAKEKPGKLFNWQRPTAEPDGDNLIIKCYPGLDYVQHNALIIATYLSMTGTVPRSGGLRTASRRGVPGGRGPAGLPTRRQDDLVIVGWGLGRLAGDGAWNYGDGYAWQRADVHGRRVLYLGYLHSIWGDVAGRVVSRLAALGARRVVYVGKVGSLDPVSRPTLSLATGSCSVLPDGPVSWPDFFGDIAASQPDVRLGVHVSSPSILLEGQNWLRGQHGTSFVDPEIGHMGRAACAAGIQFGYLHIVSNNLARHYPSDLSNERLTAVVERRSAAPGPDQRDHPGAAPAARPRTPRTEGTPVSTFPENVTQRGKLIAVAGIDGAGKSTLAAALRKTLTTMGHETIVAGKQTVDVPSDEDLSRYLGAVNAVVYRRNASVGQACGDHYWLFALAAWHSLQDRHVIRPALRAGIHVILDNSHHKTLARYTLSPEVPDGLAGQVFAHLSAPDVILFLRVSAEEALRRKRAFTPLEAGHTGSVARALHRLPEAKWPTTCPGGPARHGHPSTSLPRARTPFSMTPSRSWAAAACSTWLDIPLGLEPAAAAWKGRGDDGGIAWQAASTSGTGSPGRPDTPPFSGGRCHPAAQPHRYRGTGNRAEGRRPNPLLHRTLPLRRHLQCHASSLPAAGRIRRQRAVPGMLGAGRVPLRAPLPQDGYAPPALRAYMSQPHWLYVATFTRTLTKVGTAAAPRKASRLSEQGPLCATYLAEIPDGRTVRELEDALGRELGITQTARRAAKTSGAGEARPRPGAAGA